MSGISGNTITLTPEEREAFIHGMENPAPPTPEMIALMRRGDELLDQYRCRIEPTPDPRDAEIAALRAEVERLKKTQAECITLMGDASRRAGYAEGQNDGLRRLMQAGIENLNACVGNKHKKDVDRTIAAVCQDFRRALAGGGA